MSVRRWRSVFEYVSVDVVPSITWHQFSVTSSLGRSFIPMGNSGSLSAEDVEINFLLNYLIILFCSPHTFLPILSGEEAQESLPVSSQHLVPR